MKLNLPDSIFSQQDLKGIIFEIRAYAKWFSQASVKQRFNNTSAEQPPTISTNAAELIKQGVGEGQVNQKNLDELISALDELEVRTPHMTITLAAPPPNDLKRELVTWCRKNIAPNILVNFKFNATILGGMVVNYGSHIFDWSFKRQILATRQKFPEVLRHV